MTGLLDAAAAADRKTATDLLLLVYHQLRKLAAARMAAETAGYTLDATALVLSLSRPVAYRNGEYARAWLREALEK